MKKGGVLFGIFFLVLTLGIHAVFAANFTEMQKVNDAYDCLEENIEEKKCSELSLGEQIFSLMAVGDCKNEVLEASDDEKCWPKGRCDIKTTAQAVLALDKINANTNEAEDWLLDQKIVQTDLNWYLEVESEEAVTCSVSYLGDSYEINIAEDKRISNSAGSCLSLSSGGYWLQINPSCYESEFEITCDQTFLTTLLFRNPDSSTIHVLDVTHSASEYGTTFEHIDSFCFSTGTTCDYEGNAWTAMVLNIVGRDVSGFVPYLITAQKREYFPQPFLYMLTGFSEYKSGIMDLQINGQYWKVSKDKYYDSALALLPFQNQELLEKDLTKSWLLEIQQSNGCWDGDNIKNNAFILYSLWPRANYEDDDDEPETLDNGCSESGYYCMAESICEGDILSDYNCVGSSSCCDTKYVEQTCQEQDGEICASNEYCSGDTIYSGYLSYGEECCISGACQIQAEPEESTCEQNFGVCESFDCEDGFTESVEYSCDYGDTCCMPDQKSGGGYWWIWLLFVLIILVVVAIIYKDKLKIMLFKMQGKKDPAINNRRPPRGMPPQYNRMPQRRPPIQRKIVPQQRRPMTRPPVQRTKSPKELDDVLKKLKDMSK